MFCRHNLLSTFVSSSVDSSNGYGVSDTLVVGDAGVPVRGVGPSA